MVNPIGNGDVYQKTDGGWEQVERGTAQRQNGQRPSGTTTGPVDRDQVAHDRGAGSNAASTSRQRRERGSIGNGGFTGAKSGSRPAIGSGGHPAKGVRPRKR